MDHLLQVRIVRAAAIGFKMGAVLSTGFFLIVRLIFWGYSFTWIEEFFNLLKIAGSGGLMLALAFAAFLIFENTLQGLKSLINLRK